MPSSAFEAHFLGSCSHTLVYCIISFSLSLSLAHAYTHFPSLTLTLIFLSFLLYFTRAHLNPHLLHPPHPTFLFGACVCVCECVCVRVYRRSYSSPLSHLHTQTHTRTNIEAHFHSLSLLFHRHSPYQNLDGFLDSGIRVGPFDIDTSGSEGRARPDERR
jgi:hypothetical protein